MAKVCTKSMVLGQDGVPEGVKFIFTHGKEYTIMFEELEASILPYATAHGLLQTLGDAYSASGGDSLVAEGMFSGRLATLIDGDWKGARQGGMADEDLSWALHELTGKGLDEARAAVAAGDKAWKEARTKRADVQAIIKRRQAERAIEKAESKAETVDDLL